MRHNAYENKNPANVAGFAKLYGLYGSGVDRSVHVGRQSLLGFGDDGLEGLRVAHGELGKGATIQFDAGKVQALDEAVVGDALSADGGVDALDPQLAEITLASLAVAEVVVKEWSSCSLALRYRRERWPR